MVASSQHTPDPMLIPDQAGELFVSLGHVVPSHRDIDAAVEIGISAFLDSDWIDAWAFIRTEGGVPTKPVRKIVGAEALELEDVAVKTSGAREKSKS